MDDIKNNNKFGLELIFSLIITLTNIFKYYIFNY